MRVHVFSFVLAIGLFSNSLLAAPIIDPGTITLGTDLPNQRVGLFVRGGDSVQGLNLHLTVEDGGPEFSETGREGPRITDVNVTNSTIFRLNNGQTTAASFPQAWSVFTVASGAAVNAEGLLAVVTFDTTGITELSQFKFELTDPLGTPTDFAGVPAMIVEGVIVVDPLVPEPTSMSLAILGAMLSFAFARRARP